MGEGAADDGLPTPKPNRNDWVVRKEIDFVIIKLVNGN